LRLTNTDSNANCDAHIHSDTDRDCNRHVHSDGDSDSDVYANSDRDGNGDSNCDRIAAVYTDATASADTAAASGQQLL